MRLVHQLDEDMLDLFDMNCVRSHGFNKSRIRGDVDKAYLHVVG
jgi:hypothetical protein